MKYYQTPKVRHYIGFVTRFRVAILIFFALLMLLTALTGRFSFVLSGEHFWLQHSEELARTEAMGITPDYIQHIRVTVDTFDDQAIAALKRLHSTLLEHREVRQVDSLFSQRYVYNANNGEGSCMLMALPLDNLSAKETADFIEALREPYDRYVTKDLSSFDFYVYSSRWIDPATVQIAYPFIIDRENEQVTFWEVAVYLGLITLAILIFFRIIFHNFISGLSAVIVITATLLFTFELIYAVTGLRTLHLALGVIIVAIALVDFLYFYYRWHVTQYQANQQRALFKALSRTLTPAIWTSFITLVGLGTLLFSTNEIVKMLSISIIGASVIALALNITLLIALLSYFKVDHPRVSFARPTYYFASRELSYNPRLLRAFSAATFAILITGLVLFVTRADLLFSSGKSSTTLTLTVPFQEIDLQTLQRIDRFEAAVTAQFPYVKNVQSVAGLINLVHRAEAPNTVIKSQDILRALFFIDMYDLNQHYFDDKTGTLRLTLNILPNHELSPLLSFIKHYKALALQPTDIKTLVGSAKQKQIAVLAGSLFAALVIIGIIMGIIFRIPQMIYIGFLANAVPMAWFGLGMELLRIPVTLEMLIAMSIAVGLGSDATVHFAFKFFRARFYGRSQKQSLQITFFYGAVPVFIGALVLTFFLASLLFSPIESLREIGMHGSILIMLSLLTDLFVLPILLLSIDPFRQSRQIHKDHCTI